jgi:hypothetical protein
MYFRGEIILSAHEISQCAIRIQHVFLAVAGQGKEEEGAEDEIE